MHCLQRLVGGQEGHHGVGQVRVALVECCHQIPHQGQLCGAHTTLNLGRRAGESTQGSEGSAWQRNVCNPSTPPSTPTEAGAGGGCCVPSLIVSSWAWAETHAPAQGWYGTLCCTAAAWHHSSLCQHHAPPGWPRQDTSLQPGIRTDSTLQLSVLLYITLLNMGRR